MFCKAKKSIKEYRQFQLKFYKRAQESLEVRLAGISASINKLEEIVAKDLDETVTETSSGNSQEL
jgi:hypothetical protein|tara:strand:- start:658 stop:852 length:195 start_codon:yes stop_codon:yes gene_type:complete